MLTPHLFASLHRPYQPCLVFGLTFIAVLTGCNGAHLYNQAEDQLAQKAVASFKDAKLTETLIEERKLLQQLETRDVDVVTRDSLARRDLTLISLLLPSGENKTDGTLQNLHDVIVARVQDLTGSAPDARMDAAIGAVNDLPSASDRLAEAQAQYLAAYHHAVPGGTDPDLSKGPTPDVLARAGNDSEAVSSSYDDFNNAKRNYDNDLQASNFAPGGKLRQLIDTVSQLQNTLASSKAKANQLNAQYQSAKQAYDNALNPSPDDLTKGVQQLKEKFDSIGTPLSQVPQQILNLKLDGLTLAGPIEALKAQKQSVDDLLDALIGANGATPTAKNPSTSDRRLKLATALSNVIQDATQGTRYPKVGALLIESNRLRLEIDANQRRMDSANHVLDLLKGQRDAMLKELVLLREALADLSAIKSLDQPIPAAIHDAEPSIRQPSASALIMFGNSWTVYRVAEEQASYRIVNAREQASLDASEAALAQWQNLISSPLSQLAALHAAGIKPEDLANLIQAAGFTAVGIGVNK